MSPTDGNIIMSNELVMPTGSVLNNQEWLHSGTHVCVEISSHGDL